MKCHARFIVSMTVPISISKISESLRLPKPNERLKPRSAHHPIFLTGPEPACFRRIWNDKAPGMCFEKRRLLCMTHAPLVSILNH